MRQPDITTGLGMTALPNYSEYSFQQNSADLQVTGGWELGGRQSSWKLRTLSENRSHDVFIPYAGVVLDLSEGFSAYASYTDIFQPQNYRDRAGSYLDPVAGKSLEIGIKGEHLDGRLNSSLSVFRIQQDNVAQLDQGQVVPGTTDFAYYGAKGVTSKGFEAQVSGELATGWNLSAGIAHTIARDAEGLSVNAWAPRTQAQLFTSYRLPGEWSRLTVGGGLQWQSRTRASLFVGDKELNYAQKSFGTASLMARYAFSPQLSLQLNLNNLFNKKYYVNIDGQGQFGTPRQAMAVMNYRF
jgi:outer membrane receptor for ferric coprogen and ferric-rhodotorulic acid